VSRNRPRICIAANTCWYVFNFRARLIAALIAQGYEIVVLAPHDRYTQRLTALGARHVDLPLDNAGTHPLKDALTLWRLCRVLRAERPDTLLTFTPKLNIYGTLAARIAGVRAVANISGLGSGYLRGGWLPRLMSLLYKVSLPGAQRVFFQNEDDRALFVADALVDARKASCLPGSGVDVERFMPVAAPADDSRFVFLLVARLLWDKGVGEFVQAARILRQQHPHVEFEIVGSAECQNISAVSAEQLERWSQEAVVRYVGPTDNVIEHYARANCVVLPSYREGTSRVLLEAASMAVPLIASDVPGCREVVDDGVNGYLCRARDAEDLAEKMGWMVRITPQGRAQMGAAGRRKVIDEFDERRVIERYFEAVNAVAAIPAQRRAPEQAESPLC
jgi:glycosyltransferase involved in cell wall biosynthesis